MNLGEDFVFNLEYIKHIQRITILNKRLYIYNYTNVGSLSRYNEDTISTTKNEYINRAKIFSTYKDAFIKFNIFEANKNEIYKYWKFFYEYASNAIKKDKNSSREEKKILMDLINNDPEIKIYLGNITFIDKSFDTLCNIKNKTKKMFKKPLKLIVTLVKK